MKKWLLILGLFTFASTGILMGCENQNSLEDSIEDAGDEIRDAADDVADSIDDAL